MRTAELDTKKVLAWMRRSFSVDPINGSIVWIAPPYNHPRMLNKEAGSYMPNHSGKRYCHISYHNTKLKRSWLIFLWVNERWPKECIDHIDGNSENDRIDNIREATITQNAWNHKRRKRRIKLPMGVRSIKSGRYEARIAHNKRTLYLGAFDTPEAARAVYLEKRKELYREFAGC